MQSGDFLGYGDNSSIQTDLGGNVMAQDDIERLAVIALENFGAPDQMHIEPACLSAFVKQFYPQFRSAPGLANQTVGYDVSKVQTTAGAIDLKPNLFLRPRAGVRTLAVNSLSPQATFTAGASGVSGSSSFAAGVYQTAVTAVNDAGESSPVLGSATLTAGQNLQLAIGSIPSGVKYFKLYLSAPGGAAGTQQFAGNWANVGSGNYVSSNVQLPGLGEAFLLDMSAECMRFKQLAPLSKINFAIVTTALEFAIVMYGALFVYTPRFNTLFRNIGK
jgi:hypothetical protein